MSKRPPPAPTASAVGPCPTIIQHSRTVGAELTQYHRITGIQLLQSFSHKWNFFPEIISQLTNGSARVNYLAKNVELDFCILLYLIVCYEQISPGRIRSIKPKAITGMTNERDPLIYEDTCLQTVDAIKR